MSSIGDPGCLGEVEFLNGNDIHCVDRGVTIHISSRQSASGWERCDIKEMPLGGDHIHRVDARGAWCASGLGRRHGIGPASRQR